MADTDRIFFFGHSQYRFLLLAIARRLRARFGSEIHLYCATAQEATFWNNRNTDGTFASVVVNNVLYETTDKPVTDAEAESVLARARDLEAWLGTTINELAVSDRHLGRGYALAGFNHPRSRQSENTSYLQMVAAFSAQIEFWKREFETKRPTLIIDYAKVPALIARRLGLPFRALAGSRYKNFHQWAENEFFENSRLSEIYERVDEETAAELAAPYHAHMTLRGKFTAETSLWRLLHGSSLLLLRHAYWRLRGYEKAKGYFAWSEFRFMWRRRRDMKHISQRSVPLSALDGKRFVYYPLHTEPELALQTLSPEYFYQLSCIAALSRDLPAGVMLAVKETFAAIGRRPADFYRQICDFKNVVLIDMMELGLDVVRKADAVATITGTGGFEAAVIGKPVITFGRHNQYNFLPHVYVISDEATLKASLRAALSRAGGDSHSARDGRRFLESVLRVSFDLGQYDYIRLETFDANVVGAAVDALVETLAPPVPAGIPLQAARP